VGIDTYESGTDGRSGDMKPADRIPALKKYLTWRGYHRPIGVGEYNGYSARSIADAGEVLMSTPDVWFGCLCGVAWWAGPCAPVSGGRCWWSGRRVGWCRWR
jgi:hypothetical protein